MGSQLQHIRDPSQLDTLSAWRLVPSRAQSPIVLEAEGMPAERIRRWEGELGRLQTACGCEQGAVGLIAGIGGYLLYLLLRPGGWDHPGKKEFWMGLGVLMVAASAGKLLGLLTAQRSLKRVVREIHSQWRPGAGAGTVPQATAVETRVGRPVRASRCCGRSLRAGRSAQ